MPSWGFANTGTRFGKFVQEAAATTIEEKFADAAEVNRLTGAAPTVALHVLWDLPGGVADVPEIKALEDEVRGEAGIDQSEPVPGSGVQVWLDCEPERGDPRLALDHLLDSVEIGRRWGQRTCRCWVADGSNYPGTQSMRRRIGYMEEVFGDDACGAGATAADADRVQAV